MSTRTNVVWALLVATCRWASAPMEAAACKPLDCLIVVTQLKTAPSSVVDVGIDDGSGFVVSTLSDNNADGVIPLPSVPVGYRVAIGFPGTTTEPCLIYTTIGTEVQFGKMFDLPLFARVGGGSLGAELTKLTEPSPALHPHDTVSIADGAVSGWPAMRVVDESGVPDFPSFLQQVAALPNYTGGIVITDSFLDIRVVPEPTSITLIGFSTAGLSFARRRRVA